jgi:hypothetical protein
MHPMPLFGVGCFYFVIRRFDMSVELLSGIAGVVLSLAVAYLPGVDAWYAAKDAKGKAQIMAVLLVAVSLVIFALACLKLAADLGLGVMCDRVSLVGLVKILVAALVANQSAYMLGVKPYKGN